MGGARLHSVIIYRGSTVLAIEPGAVGTAVERPTCHPTQLIVKPTPSHSPSRQKRPGEGTQHTQGHTAEVERKTIQLCPSASHTGLSPAP